MDEDVDLEEPGTRITLTLNQDIDIYEVIRTIKEVALYQDIKVKLTLDDDYGKMSAGVIDITQISDLSTIHGEVEGQETIILDDDDVYFKAVMYKGEYGNYSTSGEKVILLARVPIEVDTGMVPNFSGYVLNIKNERKYMPLPDRERLSEKSEKALKEKLEQLLKGYFGKLTATTPEELESMPYQIPVLFMRQMGIARFFTQATKEFISSVVDHTITHIKYDSTKHLTDYGAPHNMHQVLAYRRNAFVVNNKALPPIRAVHDYCIANGLGTPQFIRIDKKTGVVTRELISQWKIPYIRDFMKEHKIKSSSSNNKSLGGLTFHYNSLGNSNTRKITDFEDIDYASTIWIKGPMKPWIDIIRCTTTDFSITKWNNRAVEYGIENEESILTEATLYGMSDFELISSKGKELFSTWYKDISSNTNNYNRYKSLDVHDASDELIEQYKEQVLYTLSQVNTHINDNKYINDQIVIQQKTTNVHDIEGNTIEVNLQNNFNFLTKAFKIIGYEQEVTDAVELQISKHEIKIPYKATKENKFKTVKNIFGHNNWFFDNNTEFSLISSKPIQDLDAWRSYQLNIKDYFGIKNKYHLAYDWRDHFDLVLKAKKEIDNVFETEDIRNMILKVTMSCDYDDYVNALNKNNKPAVINTFYKNIKKMISEPNVKDNLDVFFKTKHALNLISAGNIEKYGLLMYASDFVNHLTDELKNINKHVKITGHYEKFLNEFIPGCEAKVSEDVLSITVSCRAKDFLSVKSMIELHSTNRILVEVTPEEKSRLLLRFINPKDAHAYIDVDTLTNYEIMTQKCSCGCDNYIQNKLMKYNEDD
jgi:hypothetical protein